MWSSRRSEEPQKLVRFQHPPLRVRDFKFQISNMSRPSSRLRTLAPQAGNAGFKARTGQFKEISRTKNQIPTIRLCVMAWFLGFGSWSFNTLGCDPHGRL